MTEYKLTYFDLRGRGEPLRHLFILADVPFEDVRISYADFPNLKSSLPYGQLPILEFGDTVLSQSGAIGRFLARKFGFHGSNDVESAKIDEIGDALSDYGKVYWAFYGSNVSKEDAVKKFLEEATPKYLTKFSQILEKNGSGFLVGNKLTWADIELFNALDFYEGLTKANLTKEYPALQSFFEKIGSTPKIKEWIDKRPVTDM